MDIMWWGYKHINGSLHLKRWFGEHEYYTGDCKNNEFINIVISPFKAESIEDAMGILLNKLKEEIK